MLRSLARRRAIRPRWARAMSSPRDPRLSEPRERMEFDVVVVGAGPAGLAAAIRLKQKDENLSVCVVEKGAEVGAHILSGNVFNPKALTELLPNWREDGAPLDTPVADEEAHFLFGNGLSAQLPVPPSMHNEGNYIISLGELCRWMGEQAEAAGVEIYPGFSASELLVEGGAVRGVATSDMGLDKAGAPKDTFARGMELRARQTLLAEGCRGSLSELAMERFDLRADCEEQSYGIGLKEVWQIDEANHRPGFVMHTAGHPLDLSTYGGSFLYHMKPNLVLYGLVVGLDYKNPYLNPYEEFQRLKAHPKMRPHFEGGTCVSYGARALNEGGYQAIPRLTFPGGALLGCSAGFLNMPQIKGSHYAIKSGAVAAEAVADHLAAAGGGDAGGGTEVTAYEERLRDSWVYEELREVRNVHPASKFGTLPFMANFALEAYLLKGRAPWTLSAHGKKESELTAQVGSRHARPIAYPKKDGKLTFDLLTNLQRSGTYHDDDQPSHLVVREGMSAMPANYSHALHAAPETRFCPAGVYEYTDDPDTGKPKLVINAQNCLHCKTCSIKTPANYIEWTVPEGGGGPKYGQM